MAKKIVFTPDDVQFVYHGGETELLSQNPKKSLFPELGTTVVVQKGVKFGHVLKTFCEDPLHDVISGALTSSAAGIDDSLARFAEVLQMEPTESPQDTEIWYLKLSAPKAFEGKNSSYREYLSQRWDFSGYGEWDDGTEGGIAIEYTPVCDLQEYELRIDDEIVIYHDPEEGESDPLYRFETDLSVFGLIEAIVWEMTWEGVVKPGDRTRIDDFKDTIEDIQSGEAELSGPFENVEDFLNDSEERDSIDDLLKDEDDQGPVGAD